MQDLAVHPYVNQSKKYVKYVLLTTCYVSDNYFTYHVLRIATYSRIETGTYFYVLRIYVLRIFTYVRITYRIQNEKHRFEKHTFYRPAMASGRGRAVASGRGQWPGFVPIKP